MFLHVVARYFGNLSKNTSHYQDNLFVRGKNIKEHLNSHRLPFEKAREASMVFSISKNHFIYHRLRVLGHTVSGRTQDPEKIAAS